MTPSDLTPRQRAGQYIVNLALGGLVRLALALPYAMRVRLMGWMVSRIVAPIAYRGRVRNNLTHIWPDIAPSRIREMERAVPDNAGRTLIEIYSGPELKARLGEGTLEGPGLAALDAAHAAKRPVVLVSGHFGNYDAFRAAVAMRYGNVGALYRPLNNVYFNRHYVRAMESIATPMFARGRRGLAEMVKYLRQGNIIAMLTDQHFGKGAALSFFGQPAFTATSAAEMALKYDALMIPIYGIRQPDGLSFRVVVQEPLAHSTATEMSQALNDSLEAMTREYPDQWFWIHRRWKPGSQDSES
ncbi:lysophospholipid acyltransferase family protein [Pseudooceanicola spongiae]|jgi:Kdo2-lipid IVA lauroyltransferase/acyltransferase|uniref:Lauroyl acyltransferase n=1 Tax=Pseudooceanicola spongiae TaxID=2613965 RepID=A0A7L9WKZ1_9RHOB|nr:lysophospholipid acyltransferase family protein [Pseudooceanicola spongiae]QOL79720.1 lauroyl acyltransferase [Pseudooceanicola spongiae]